MIDIAVNTVAQALDMVEELRQAGLVANRDFEWTFQPSDAQIWGGPQITHHVKIEFQDPALETFYRMKWQ